MSHRSHWASFMRFLSGLLWMLLYALASFMMWVTDDRRLWVKFFYAFIRALQRMFP